MAEDRFIVKIGNTETLVVVNSEPWVGNPLYQNASVAFEGFPMVGKRVIIHESEDHPTYRDVFSHMARECFFHARSMYIAANG